MTQRNMSSQLAEFALGLVARAAIKGEEAANTVEVQRWLSAIADGRLVVLPDQPAAPAAPGDDEKPQAPAEDHDHG